ncbi:MAG: hypothetical protein ACK58L_07860 [Planctomycetota bacterium]
MKMTPVTTLRHAATAIMLLLLALVGLEFWLRSREQPMIAIICGQSDPTDQTLLVPSSVVHHELRRVSSILHQTGIDQKPISVQINSMGCRGDEIQPLTPKDTYRILVLGDDSICGLSVPENETVSARMKQFLSKSISTKLEIINAGVPGYCPLLCCIRYQHELFRLKPDLVILHVDMTDIADDCAYRNLLQKDGSQMVCSHASLRLPPKPDNPVLHFVKQSATATWLASKTRAHASDIFNLSNSRATCSVGMNWIRDNPPDLRLQIRHALDPIRNLRDTVEEHGGHFLVTSAPVLWQVASADEAPELSRDLGIKGATPYETDFPFEVIEKFCRKSDISFCNTVTAFQTEKAARLFSKDTPVLSRIGMALYAREIATFLLEYPQAPWNDIATE